MPTLLKRLLSGAVYVALIVLSLLFTNWAFPALCTLFVFLGVWEYADLTRSVGSASSLLKWFDIFVALLAMLPIPIFPSHGIGISIFILSIYSLLRLAIQLFIRSSTPLTDVARSFLGVAWIVIPLALLAFIMSFAPNDHLRFLLLVMFIMIWLNDSGAFVFGSLFGRTKLFERISPKKTWEGFWGGIAVTAIFGYFSPSIFPAIHVLPSTMALFGLILGVVATIGDLVESMFKRALNVKDSGNIMPGHGGILDRIDSLLFVAPCTVWFILFCLN